MLSLRNILFSFTLSFVFYFIPFSTNKPLADQKSSFEKPRMLNNYGMPGSIDTPTAEAFPDGQFSISNSIFAGTIRTNLSFQVSENITAAFRYSRLPSATGGS